MYYFGFGLAAGCRLLTCCPVCYSGQCARGSFPEPVCDVGDQITSLMIDEQHGLADRKRFRIYVCKHAMPRCPKPDHVTCVHGSGTPPQKLCDFKRGSDEYQSATRCVSEARLTEARAHALVRSYALTSEARSHEQHIYFNRYFNYCQNITSDSGSYRIMGYIV